MAEDRNWRSAKAYDYVDRLDPASLAWEFLRRNRKYKERYDKLSEKERGSSNDEMTRHWGLRFPGRSKSISRASACFLLTALGSWNTSFGSLQPGTTAG